ncbi:hypothetical protein GA0116948_108120 [Chitinophaga costaii]|uniref:Uncharacterized protein n=1 Tax=Chitinophaga costaii TaxID=1335309 RepID=A0A1C4EHM2_9BACT|nr:hypothetical protein [Chitinophaga costaii]SCC43065.1 hypothetical protein GA0116948_108120 [Chitinophaga costaii]
MTALEVSTGAYYTDIIDKEDHRLWQIQQIENGNSVFEGTAYSQWNGIEWD